jgi:hypothetical protein
MGSFIEFTLREGDQDPEFKDIEKLPIDIDQIAFFWPLKDEGGGCRLSLKNGGVVSVRESYDEVRWVTKAKTIREINQAHVENLTKSIDEFGVKSNRNLDLREKLLREAMEVFPLNAHDDIFQSIADTMNEELSAYSEFEMITADQVEENYSRIVAFVRNPDEHDFSDSVGEGTRTMLRIKLAALTGEELGPPVSDKNKNYNHEYVEPPKISTPQM